MGFGVSGPRPETQPSGSDQVLRAELAAPVGTVRFLHEIEIAANLSHPHILALFDSGEADGFLYYVMPLVEGEREGTWIPISIALGSRKTDHARCASSSSSRPRVTNSTLMLSPRSKNSSRNC